MNYKVQRYLHWLRRIKYCRGFGVQSPSAYRFIRYVINEHYPYYAYDELRKELPRLDSLTRKRMELYFRISNFRQASLWLDFCERNDVIATYVGRGARSRAKASRRPHPVCYRGHRLQRHCQTHVAEIAGERHYKRQLRFVLSWHCLLRPQALQEQLYCELLESTK